MSHAEVVLRALRAASPRSTHAHVPYQVELARDVTRRADALPPDERLSLRAAITAASAEVVEATPQVRRLELRHHGDWSFTVAVDPARRIVSVFNLRRDPAPASARAA